MYDNSIFFSKFSLLVPKLPGPNDHYDIGEASICFTKSYADFSTKQLEQSARNTQGPFAVPFGCEFMSFLGRNPRI